MEIFFILHLILMPLGFILMTAGVVIVRYFRKRMWWFRFHKMLGTLATVLFSAGGMAAITMIQLAGRHHFSVPHTWLGATVILMMVGALVAGFAQTRVANKKRMRLIHRSLGRIVVVLALFAVISGAMAAGII